MHQRTCSVILSVSGRRLLGEGCPKRSPQTGCGARTLLPLRELCPGVEQHRGRVPHPSVEFLCMFCHKTSWPALSKSPRTRAGGHQVLEPPALIFGSPHPGHFLWDGRRKNTSLLLGCWRDGQICGDPEGCSIQQIWRWAQVPPLVLGLVQPKP